jgi:predicted amidohydrolase
MLQTALYWEDIGANLAHFEEKIFNLSQNVDIIVLPEMFNTGFSLNADTLAEPENLYTSKWMIQMARQTNALVCGSFMIKKDRNYYNRFYAVDAKGVLARYDKVHLFSLTYEDKIFTRGQEKVVFQYKSWNICPVICYDLRFPLLMRNKTNNDSYQYDLLLVVANWPSARIKAWQHLLAARAVENSIYSLGVNIVGKDGRGFEYNGHSLAFSPYAEPLNSLEETDSDIYITLSAGLLNTYRQKYPFLKDEKLV